MRSTGVGSAIAHHGEILQGVFDVGGNLLPALVTLPNPQLSSTAVYEAGDGELVVRPAWKVKARRALAAVIARTEGAQQGGVLVLDSNIPMERGLGSSTADVVSAILAGASSIGRQVSPELVGEVAIEAEQAADCIMFGHRLVLYANRHGRIVEDFGATLPQLDIVGFDPGGQGVDTLLARFPPPYDRLALEEFARLRALLREGVARRSPTVVGAVATRSAEINQRYLPNPAFGLAKRIVAQAGALGFQVAHTGRVVGLLFDPDEKDVEQRIAQACTALTTAGISDSWRFQAPNPVRERE